MKNTINRKRQEGLGLSQSKGFTIIEVLIVLAIAGLIILIVFLAVPALQRNSRNTQRKNDVASLTGAVQESTNNNGGTLPALATAVANAKLGYYAAATDVQGNTLNNAVVNTVTPVSTQVIINNFTKCPAGALPAYATAVPTGTNATKRSATAIYAVETSGGFQTQCQDL